MNHTRVGIARNVRYLSTSPTPPESLFTSLAKKLNIRVDVTTPPTILTPQPEVPPKIDVIEKRYGFGKVMRMIDVKDWEDHHYQYVGGALASWVTTNIWRRALRPYFLAVKAYIDKEFSDGHRIAVYIQANNQASEQLDWQGQIIHVGVIYTTARAVGDSGITIFRNDYFYHSKRIDNLTVNNKDYVIAPEKVIEASVTAAVEKKMEEKFLRMKEDVTAEVEKKIEEQFLRMKEDVEAKVESIQVAVEEKFNKIDDKLETVEQMEQKLKGHMEQEIANGFKLFEDKVLLSFKQMTEREEKKDSR